MNFVVTSVLLISIGSVAVRASGAITFHVTDEFGSPISHGGTVEFESSSGVTVLTKQIINGRVDVEDLPFGFHSAVFNRDRCNETVIRRVRFRYGSHDSYRVVLNSCHIQGLTGGNGCAIDIRVQDAEGHPRSGCELVESSGRLTPCDKYGRIHTLVRFGVSRLEIRRSGKTLPLDVECRKVEVIERVVVLR